MTDYNIYYYHNRQLTFIGNLALADVVTDIDKVTAYLKQYQRGDYWIYTEYPHYYRIDFGSYTDFYYLTTLSKQQLSQQLALK